MKPPLILFLVLLLAFVLRFYHLGTTPPSLDWDEASIGYNAYSLLKTGSDEYGNRLPFSLRSFDDYKPPAYAYAAIPPIALLGLTEFAVRLPSALAGTLTVLATFFLVRSLCRLDPEESQRWTDFTSYTATFLLAVSPWHIQFSRVAFEANLALFFFVLGTLFLVVFLHHKRSRFFFLMVLSYVFSLYSYHSARLVVPIFLLGILIFFRRFVWEQRKTLIVGSCVTFVMLLPIISTAIGNNGLEARFGQVSVFSAAGLRDTAKTTVDFERRLYQQDQNVGDLFGKLVHSKTITYARLLAKNYLDHFNFDFLFLSADGNGRHHAPDVGLLYLGEFPFLTLGLFFLLSHRPKWLFILAWWFLSAPMASILTAETPHAVRSLLYLPTYQIVTAYGLRKTYDWSLHLPKHLHILLRSAILLIFLTNFFYFFHQYFLHLNLEYASSWQYGYKEMVNKVKSLGQPYNQILVTRRYDQPYIYFLFYGPADPHIKNDGSFNKGFGKYRFINWGATVDKVKDSLPGTVLTVSAPDDFFQRKVVLDKIFYPNQKVAFIIGHQ